MMKLFNINFKRKNEAGAIGIIGGADGPTAVFHTKLSDAKIKENKLKQEKFLQQAANSIVANGHNFSDIVQYLKENYQAVDYQLSPKQIEILKVNVIMNNFCEVLERPKPLVDNPTKKQIMQYHQNDTSFMQAVNYPAERLGLDMRAYKLPCETEEEVIVELEMKSEYLCIKNGNEDLMTDLLFWQGVTQTDIKNRTPRFIAYAYAMKGKDVL